MKKKFLVLALASIASAASMSSISYAEPNYDLGEVDTNVAPVFDQTAQNIRATQQYARVALLDNSLHYADTVFDQGVTAGKQLWGKASYSKLKNDTLKITAPSVKLGYTHRVNDDFLLGIGGLFSRESNDWNRSFLIPFETKNSIFGLSLYGRYQPNEWFVDFILGGMYSRNAYTYPALPEDEDASNEDEDEDGYVNEDNLGDGYGDGYGDGDGDGDGDGGDGGDASDLAPSSFKKSQKGLMIGARLGVEYPLAQQFTITPSVQGTWGYSSAMFEDSKSYHVSTLGAHLSGDWKVKPEVQLGADLAADAIWSNVDKSFTEAAPGPDVFGLEKGLKNDWRWKAGLHANFAPVKNVELGAAAAYQRYQKSKLGGMTFELSAKYRF